MSTVPSAPGPVSSAASGPAPPSNVRVFAFFVSVPSGLATVATAGFARWLRALKRGRPGDVASAVLHTGKTFVLTGRMEALTRGEGLNFHDTLFRVILTQDANARFDGEGEALRLVSVMLSLGILVNIGMRRHVF